MVAVVMFVGSAYAAATPPQPSGGMFSPPHYDSGWDANGNGLYDFLVVNASITVDTSDNYTVDGSLHDANFTLYVYNRTSIFLTPGSWSVSVFFSGPVINSSEVDGPYAVDLFLWDGAFSLLDTDTYTTNAYNYTDFDPPFADFAPPHSDSGVDTDADERFNFLEVDVNLTVNVAGDYLVLAFLHDADFTLTLFSSGSATLDPGDRSVAVPFSGSALNASGVDGPYIVELALQHVASSQLLGFDQHVTAPYSHLEFEEPPSMTSPFAQTTPTIDGTIAAGEWADAHVEDLAAIPGNVVPALLLVMNDGDFLYIAYDAVGDTTQDPMDVASIAFDTGNDGTGTNGHEDEFVQGGWVPNDQGHFVRSGEFNWTLHDSPYDPTLPNHAGLASAWSFGSSPASGGDHRIYEFKIPLALLGAQPGDALGFFGGSHPAPGVFDETVLGWSLWPEYSSGPIPLGRYGDLFLAGAPDAVAPTISITSPTAGAVVTANSVTVSWNASDADSGIDRFEVRVDEGAAIVRPFDATSYTATGLIDGPHTISVTAFDVAGNSGSDSVGVTVDANPPSIQITAPSEGGAVGSSNVAVAWSASDAGSGIANFEVSLDGGAATSLPGSTRAHTFTSVGEGAHDVIVTAFDDAGHSRSASISFVVDTTSPVVTITPSGEFLTTDSVDVTWTASDAGSGVSAIEVQFDSDPAVTLAGTATTHRFTGASDGPHTIRVTGIDEAGNRATSTSTITVDTTNPEVSISSPVADAVVNSGEVTIRFSTGDATSGVDRIEVQVDGGPRLTLSASELSHAIGGLSDGTHTVTVTVFDRAGHSKTATVSFRVDTSFLSPSGPSGVAGIAALAILIAAAVALVALALARRKRDRSKQPPPPPPE